MAEKKDVSGGTKSSNQGDLTASQRDDDDSESRTTSLQVLIELGKSLDLAGKDLSNFIAQQQAVEREERQRAREARTVHAEARAREAEAEERRSAREAEVEEKQRAREAQEQEKQTVREHEFAMERLRLENQARVAAPREHKEDGRSSKNSLPKLDVPKFENKLLDNIAKYLDLFENVMKHNQYDQSVWPLALRTAVIGTKLEPIMSMGGTYEEIKKEILVAHGQTAEKLWHQLITTSQGSESFRQWSVRVADKLAQFFRLAVNVNDRGQEHDDTVTEEKKSVLHYE